MILKGDRPLTLTDGYRNKRLGSAYCDTYHVVGASVQGKMHQRNKTSRQDAFSIRCGKRWMAVAVSDGLGSRPKSHYGSSYAVHTLCSSLLRFIPKSQQTGISEESIQSAFYETHSGLVNFASEYACEVGDLHCTLLGMILDSQTGKAVLGQVGDGLLMGLTNDGEAVPLIDAPVPDQPGATYTVTQENWQKHFRPQVLSTEVFRTFYLMTDGVADDCQYGPPPDILQRWASDMDSQIRMVPSLAANAKRLKKYLATYQSKGSFDDRTLVIIYRDV